MPTIQKRVANHLLRNTTLLFISNSQQVGRDPLSGRGNSLPGRQNLYLVMVLVLCGSQYNVLFCFVGHQLLTTEKHTLELFYDALRVVHLTHPEVTKYATLDYFMGQIVPLK